MDDEALAAWRRKRLEALRDALGGNTALGKKLGYQNGAHVGQMISGHRPISEKTVFKAERIVADDGRTFRGWFAHNEPPPPAVPTGEVFKRLSDQDTELLTQFGLLIDEEDKAAVLELATRLAKKTEKIRAQVFERLGVGQPEAKAANAAKKVIARASLKPGPHLKQQSLFDQQKPPSTDGQRQTGFPFSDTP